MASQLKKRRTSKRSNAASRFKRLAKELRQRIADAEESERRKVLDQVSSTRVRTPKLVGHVSQKKRKKTLPGISLGMDGSHNHGCPHLHCSVGKQAHVATVSFGTGKVIIGKLGKIARKEVKAWVLERKTQLLELWNAMRAGNPVEELIASIRAW